MRGGSCPGHRFRSGRAAALGAALAAAALAAAPAAAQEAVTLDQYRPAPLATDGFVVSRPDDLGHLRGGLRLDFDYAMNPLVYEEDVGDSATEVGAIVKDQLVLQLVGTLGLLDRLVLWVGLPVNLFMSGHRYEGLPEPDGSRPGDLYLGIRGRIWGEPDELFGFGAQATVSAPLAHAADDDVWFSGEQNFAGTAALLAELRWRYVVVTANVGARFRQPSDVTTTEVGQELLWGVGLTFPILPGTLAAFVEAWGATTFVVFGAREASPLELLAGLRVWEDHGLAVSAAASAGVVRGYGAPDVRGVVSLAWTLPEEEAPPPDGEPSDPTPPPAEPVEPAPEPAVEPTTPPAPAGAAPAPPAAVAPPPQEPEPLPPTPAALPAPTPPLATPPAAPPTTPTPPAPTPPPATPTPLPAAEPIAAPGFAPGPTTGGRNDYPDVLPPDAAPGP